MASLVHDAPCINSFCMNVQFVVYRDVYAMRSPKASLVKGGGFAVGKIGGIIENTYVSTYLNPSVSHTLDSSLYKGAYD